MVHKILKVIINPEYILRIGMAWLTERDCFSYLWDALFLHFGCHAILTFRVNHKGLIILGFMLF
jgi:hypothetical protein